MNQKEWIAVIVSVFVLGFFFVFGPGLISIFTGKGNPGLGSRQPRFMTNDTVIGTGDVAVSGTRITVHYVGRLVDGTVFDSSIARNEPFQFVLGAGQVIQGWEEGIVGMRVGGKRTLTISPELGYGANANGPIPANSTLIFDVELLKVEK